MAIILTMINGAHAHLLVNHVPLFAVTFGLIALLWSILRPSRDMRWAAIALFFIAGVFSWIAMETGESAEDIAKLLPDVTKGLIHNHEEAAEFANITTTILALAGLVLAYIEKFKQRFFKIAQIIVVFLAIVSSGAMIRTALLGGLIRHTEIRESLEEAPAISSEKNEES